MKENKQSNLVYSLFARWQGNILSQTSFLDTYVYAPTVYTRSEAKERGVEEVEKRNRLLSS
jgi:hypothetical protein